MPFFQLFPISLQFYKKERFLGHSLEIKKGPAFLLGLNKALTISHDYYEALYILGGHPPLNRQEYELKKLAKIVEFKGEIKAYKEMVQLIHRQTLNDFYTWHRAFRDKKTWDILAQLNPTKITLLNALKEKWLNHAPYSHFTAQGIFDAIKHLRTMIRFLHREQRVAQRLWVRNKNILLKSKLIKALNAQEKELIHHQRLLCESLYQRIELCINEGSPERPDLLAILLVKLRTLGINTTCFHHDYDPKQSPFPLLEACETIFSYGSVEQKNTLEKILSLKNGQEEKTPLKLIGDKAGLSLVPMEFLKYVSVKPPLFAFLLQGQQFGYEFFKLKERQELLFQLMTSSHSEFKASPKALNDRGWQKLLKIADLIEAELVRVKAMVPRHYSGESNQLLKAWTIFLKSRKKYYEEEKLRHLENLALQEKPFNYSNIYNFPIKEAISQKLLHL